MAEKLTKSIVDKARSEVRDYSALADVRPMSANTGTAPGGALRLVG